MYKALSYFTDLQDGNFAYKAGDIYPRNGYKPTQERIKELSTDANKRNVPVIVEINPIKADKTESKAIMPEDVINPPAGEITEEKPKRTRKAKKDA